jgi:hypothetical protein
LNLPQIAHVEHLIQPLSATDQGPFDVNVTFKIAPTFAVLSLLAAKPGLIYQANAQTIGSSYTSTAPKGCRMIGKPSELDGSTTRLCPGKDKLKVVGAPAGPWNW